MIGGDVTLAGNTTTFYAGNPLSLQSNLYLNGAGAVVSGSAITLAADKTIQGQGSITAPLVNNGDVIATGSGLSLSSGSIDNEGPMTGPLQFSNDTITNNNLIQKNSSGDTLSFSSSTVSGTGRIDPKGGTLRGYRPR